MVVVSPGTVAVLVIAVFVAVFLLVVSLSLVTYHWRSRPAGPAGPRLSPPDEPDARC